MKDNNQTLLISILIILVVFVFGGFGFSMMSGYGNMMYGFFPSFGFMWILGPLFMILVAVALILLIIWLIKQIESKK